MPSLYEMTEAAQYLYELIELGEIDEQVIKDTLDSMGANEKVETYCQLIKQSSADADMYENEIKRLTNRKQTIDNNIKRLRGSLFEFLKASKQSQIRVGTFLVSTTKRNTLVIPDVSVLAKKWCKISYTPDKTAIKDALKKGIAVKGAMFQESEGITIR